MVMSVTGDKFTYPASLRAEESSITFSRESLFYSLFCKAVTVILLPILKTAKVNGQKGRSSCGLPGDRLYKGQGMLCPKMWKSISFWNCRARACCPNAEV